MKSTYRMSEGDRLSRRRPREIYYNASDDRRGDGECDVGHGTNYRYFRMDQACARRETAKRSRSFGSTVTGTWRTGGQHVGTGLLRAGESGEAKDNIEHEVRHFYCDRRCRRVDLTLDGFRPRPWRGTKTGGIYQRAGQVFERGTRDNTNMDRDGHGPAALVRGLFEAGVRTRRPLDHMSGATSRGRREGRRETLDRPFEYALVLQRPKPN